MLSASVGRDSCQRISAHPSNANSVNYRHQAECAAIIFFLTKPRPGGERAENGFEQEKTEATEILSFRSLFSPFAPVQTSSICVKPRDLRARVFSRSQPRFVLRQNFTTDFADSMDETLAARINYVSVSSVQSVVQFSAVKVSFLVKAAA
jgi:hypothetical protein